MAREACYLHSRSPGQWFLRVWTMLLGCEAERLVLTKLENTEVSKAWKYKFPADHQMNQLASILNPSHQLQSHANKKHLHPH